MSTKGFSLIETLLILSVLSILTLCFPFLKINDASSLTFTTKTIYYKLLQAQSESVLQKKLINVDFQGNRLHIGEQTMILKSSIACNSVSFHFTPMGNVSNATTISCTLHDKKREIVLQLGAGRIYVR